MPLYNRLPRKLALFIEAAIPALLIFAILGIGYVKTSANARLSHQAKASTAALAAATREADTKLAAVQRQDAITACDTTHASDVALHDFLVKFFGTPDPRTQQFLDGLAFAQNVAYGRCLSKAHHP